MGLWQVLEADRYRVERSVLGGDAVAGLSVRDWLGHNGIRVSTRLERSQYSYRDELRVLSAGDLLIFGAVDLFDDLRPDVSVSRDTLRGLSFNIRSALPDLPRALSAEVYIDEHGRLLSRK